MGLACTTPAAPASAPAGSSAAQRLLTASAVALRSASGYAMQGTIFEHKQTVRFRLVTRSSGALAVSFSFGATSYEAIVVAGAFYIEGNEAFWRPKLGAQAAAVSGRWVQAPIAGAPAALTKLGNFAPARLSRCPTDHRGTLTAGGRTSVGGRSAVLLQDAGGVPGSQPGRLAVAGTGPPYPLQVSLTGRQLPGGVVDPCNSGRGANFRGTVTLTEFGEIPGIEAPVGAIHAG